MNIVIIEDEIVSCEDLAEMIQQTQPDGAIRAMLHSVKEAKAYFKTEPDVDLIFSDIQLGDGLSFEIFRHVTTQAPIIFCTAFDDYAIEAFKTNGIDFILKPFDRDSVAAAIDKYHQLKMHFAPRMLDYDGLIRQLTSNKKGVSSILVHYKDKVVPIGLEDIALFYIERDVTRILCFDGKIFLADQNLDQLEKTCGEGFFRVNRQMLVNRTAVKDASHFFPRKYIANITVPFKDPVTVSKNRTTDFLDWLQRR